MMSSKTASLSPSLCGFSYEEKTKLETIVRSVSKTIGLTMPTIECVYHARCVSKSKNTE